MCILSKGLISSNSATRLYVSYIKNQFHNLDILTQEIQRNNSRWLVICSNIAIQRRIMFTSRLVPVDYCMPVCI